MYIEVMPAYGRDYNSKKEVLTAWDSGADFFDTHSERYLSKRDADRDPDLRIIVRYGKGRKVMNI